MYCKCTARANRFEQRADTYDTVFSCARKEREKTATSTRPIASSHEAYCTYYFSHRSPVDYTADDRVRMKERQNTLLAHEPFQASWFRVKRFACDEHRAIFIQLLLLSDPKMACAGR